MASMTRFLRAALTGTEAFRTAETVEVETPARRATSRIVCFARSHSSAKHVRANDFTTVRLAAPSPNG